MIMRWVPQPPSRSQAGLLEESMVEQEDEVAAVGAPLTRQPSGNDGVIIKKAVNDYLKWPERTSKISNDTSDWPLRLHTASWEDQGGGLPNWTRGPPNWIASSSDILLGGLYIKIKSCYVWPWRLWLWLPQAYISHIHIHIPPHIHFATKKINLPSCRLLCCCSRRENKRVEDGRFAGDQIFIDFVLPDLLRVDKVMVSSQMSKVFLHHVDYLRTSGGGIFHWEKPGQFLFLSSTLPSKFSWRQVLGNGSLGSDLTPHFPEGPHFPFIVYFYVAFRHCLRFGVHERWFWLQAFFSSILASTSCVTSLIGEVIVPSLLWKWEKGRLDLE